MVRLMALIELFYPQVNAWHISVDAGSGLVHTVVVTAANMADVAQAHAPLHGEEGWLG